jgi:hypothetical protein
MMELISDIELSEMKNSSFGLRKHPDDLCSLIALLELYPWNILVYGAKPI